MNSRLNADELAEIDRQRAAAGGIRRGEWLRMCWLRERPAARIPEANRLAYISLARGSANLTQIAGHLGKAGYSALQYAVAEVETKLQLLRTSLICAADVPAGPALAEDLSEVSNREHRKARRGPVPLPIGDARDHAVSVRLTGAELAALDKQRFTGRGYRRGEWLRMAWQELTQPAQVAEIAAQPYAALIKSGDNLNVLAHHLNQGGILATRLSLLEDELRAFQSAMVNLRETSK